MGTQKSWWYRLWISCAIVAVFAVPAAADLAGATTLRPIVAVVGVAADAGAGWAPYSHRLSTRVEHTFDRFLVVMGDVGAFWLWTVLSVAAFLLIAAFASVVDARMLALRHEQPGALARYLGYGIRTFFAILFDRHTPYAARISLGVALVYWLVPFDLITDTSGLAGFLDDLVVTVAAAKGFVYLCPAGLVSGHAHAVEARAERRREVKPPPSAARR